jgi:hypothetical protein
VLIDRHEKQPLPMYKPSTWCSLCGLSSKVVLLSSWMRVLPFCSLYSPLCFGVLLFIFLLVRFHHLLTLKSPIFPMYLRIYDIFFTEQVTKVTLNIDSVDIHPQLNHKDDTLKSSNELCSALYWGLSFVCLVWFYTSSSSFAPHKIVHYCLCYIGKIMYRDIFAYNLIADSNPQPPTKEPWVLQVA